MATTSEMCKAPPWCLRLLKSMPIEPVVFLYMFTSFVHISVFQSLLYDKSNFQATKDRSTALNETDVAMKTQLLANRIFLLSNICLLLPSLFVTAICASVSDRQQKANTILLPFVGLLIADGNYLIQSYFITLNPYLLLISDVCFGCFGGFTAILGAIFAHTAKYDCGRGSSFRIASTEGFIGLGGTLGLLLSGVLCSDLSYFGVFSLNAVLHLCMLIYLIIQTNCKQPQRSGERQTPLSICAQLLYHTKQLQRTLSKRRPGKGRLHIWLGLIAFSLTYFLSNGSQHIMFFYFKYRYDWSLKEYGIFRGIYYGVTSILVIFLYPLLKLIGVADLWLALVGITCRLVGSAIIGLAPEGRLAFAALGFLIFSRFNPTGLRSMLSTQVDTDEQGKLFGIIAISEGVMGMAASSTFNALFPATLRIHQGFCFLLISLLYTIPIACTLYAIYSLKRAAPEEK